MTINYTRDGARDLGQLPARMMISNLSFDCDVAVAPCQLRAITGLAPQTVITPKDLECACFYLSEHGRFEAVNVTCKSLNDKWRISFALRARWLLKNVSISGIWFGKEYARQRYLMGPGEVFDEQKHAESLKNFYTYYRKHGYLGVKIVDDIRRDAKQKTVHVHLAINRGARGMITHVDIKSSVRGSALIGLLAYTKHKLMHTVYQAKRIKRMARYIRQWLARRGYPFARVKSTYSYKKGRVTVCFALDVDQENRIEMSGIPVATQRLLMDQIMSDVKDASLLTVPLLTQQITSWYKQQGYLNIAVHISRTEAWNLAIVPGERVVLARTELRGVARVRHHAVSVLCKKCIGGRRFSGGYTSDVDIKRGLEDVVAWYRGQGFWDARVTGYAVEKQTDGAWVLAITLDEGVQRLLKRVTIERFEAFQHQGPFKAFQSLPHPIPFNRTILEPQKEWLVQRLAAQGLSVRTVTPDLREQADGIEVVWRIEQDQEKTVFGRTLITGLPRVGVTRLLRANACMPGALWDVHALEKTYHHLQELGVFSQIYVRPGRVRDPVGRTPVIVHAVADDPFEIQAQVGGLLANRTSGSTYMVGGSVVWKNPSGQADLIKIGANVTEFIREVTFAYGYPQFAGLPARLQFECYDRTLRYEVNQNIEKLEVYRAVEDGGRIGLVYHEDPVLCGLSLGFFGPKMRYVRPGYAQAVHFEPALIDQREPYFSIEPQIVWSSIDNKSNPTLGFTASLRGMGGICLQGNAASFMRIQLEQSLYVPLGSALVAALHAECGCLATRSFNRLLPSYRFYLGGPTSVRSYQPGMGAPLAPCIDGQCCYWAPQGSRYTGLLNAELRFVLSPTLSAVLFEDVGFLHNECTRAWDRSTGTGFGVCYATVIGPLRFDIAWKGEHSPVEPPYAWYVTIGHAF